MRIHCYQNLTKITQEIFSTSMDLKNPKWNIKTRMKQSMKRIIHHNQVGLNPMQGWFRMIHISRYKKKQHKHLHRYWRGVSQHSTAGFNF